MRRLAPLIAVLLLVVFAAPVGAVNIGAAGDISNPPGGGRADVQTARLLTTTGNGIGLVLALGDTQYECGEPENFRAAYDLSWGQVRTITRPSVGNHEYHRVIVSHPSAAGRGLLPVLRRSYATAPGVLQL